MHSTIDLNKILHRKGLDPNTPYVGVVVDDNDPEYLGRIRVRLDIFQDSIPDEDLPWCIPEENFHPFGLLGGDVEQRTGSFAGVPRRGNKVAVYFRHGGDANNPSYTSVPIDVENILPEFETNYPHRKGVVLHNGYAVVIDTKTNEIFVHNPGDVNLTVLGDVNQTVVGNLQQKITNSTGGIPGYLANAPDSVLGSLAAHPQKKIPFEGLLGGDAGNYHTYVKGHMTVQVDGNVEEKIAGKFKRTVGGKIEDKSGSSMDLKAGSTINAKAGTINLN
tara:strand:+ start:83743 stop:84570 length:828 start_codon:yes stop_codon:yes gene_type:complete